MDQLERQVAKAHRRLVLEQFLNRLVWCLFTGLLVALVAVAAPKLMVLANLPANWNTLWLIGGVAGGLLVAMIWTIVSRRSQLEAAMEIDGRFGLRERVASSLCLSAADRESAVGQAVTNDAVRAIRRIEVGDKIRVSFSRQAWLPLVPALLAFFLVSFVNNRPATSQSQAQQAQEQAEQVKTAAEELRQKIAEQKKQLEERGLKDADGIFEKIEQSTAELAKKNEMDRTKAVVKLNDLGKQLAKRRQKIGGKEELQRQLNKLKDLQNGPADKMANAMKQGNWKNAMELAEELANKIAEGKLSDKQKQQMQQQLQQMQEKLAEMEAAHQQAIDNLKKQIDEQRRQGNLAKAGELQQKLDQLAQQQPRMQKLQQMAAQMEAAQQAMQQGDAQQAAEAMQQMADQLAQMQQDGEELEMLDAAMDQIEMAKNAMACGECQGMGCQACQNMGNDGNQNPLAQQQPNGGGPGIGRGRGAGRDRDQELDANLRDSQVRQEVGQGNSVFGGFTEGGNVKGNVMEQIKQEMASQGSEPANPLASERLPRSRREHAEEYFRSFR